jgi:gamma-glutamylputrescine oxidase
MEREFPFNSGSFWIDRPPERRAPLDGSIRCDVAIVGGGYIGLNAALRLREAGIDVVLLEADFCGAGASGRAAGHIGSTIGKDIFTCLKTFGPKKGLELARLGDAAVDAFNARVAALGIDCDYVQSGNAVCGVHASQHDALKRSVDLAISHGLNFDYLDEQAMRARGLPDAFKFGALETRGGIMNPGKFVLGLRNAALAAGVRIFETSAVRRIGRGAVVELATDSGTVRADKVLLAVNAYGPERLGLFKSRVLPVRDSLFVTRPLTDKERAALGWSGQEGVYTAHESLESYRWTADGRIVGGSKEVTYAFGSRLDQAYDPRIFQGLEATFRDRFPQLAQVEIAQWWGGWIAMTLDFLPSWGRLGGAGEVYFYAGCNGHGIPQGVLMGGAMADLLLGVRSPHLALLKRFETPLPPEPLRWAVFNLINQSLLAKDRRIDAMVRATGASPPPA